MPMCRPVPDRPGIDGACRPAGNRFRIGIRLQPGLNREEFMKHLCKQHLVRLLYAATFGVWGCDTATLANASWLTWGSATKKRSSGAPQSAISVVRPRRIFPRSPRNAERPGDASGLPGKASVSPRRPSRIAKKLSASPRRPFRITVKAATSRYRHAPHRYIQLPPRYGKSPNRYEINFLKVSTCSIAFVQDSLCLNLQDANVWTIVRNSYYAGNR